MVPPHLRRRALAWIGLVGIVCLARPSSLPAAQVEPTRACETAAQRMDDVLDVSLTADYANLDVILEDVRRDQRRFKGVRAACAASLAMNEIVIHLITERYVEADSVMRVFKTEYLAFVPAKEKMGYHINRGWVLATLGEIQESTLEYVEAAALADALDPELAAQALLNASLTFSEVGDPGRARSYIEEAEKRARPHVGTPEVRAILGEIELERAILIQKRASSPADHALVMEGAERALTFIGDADAQTPDRAMSHLVIARSALRSGDAARGMEALRKARPLAEQSESYASYVGVERWMTEGEWLILNGDLAGARQAYTRSTEAARDAGLPSNSIDGLIALAEIAEREERWEQAKEHYQEAVNVAETIRQRQGLQDWSLSASDRVSTPSERLAALLARQGDASEAFQVLDASRARRLLDLRANLRSRQKLSANKRARVDTLLNALDDVRLAIPTASLSERSALDAKATRIQRDLAAATGMELQAPDPIDVGALQDTLAARNQVLVSYLLSPREAWAFVVSADTVATVPLAEGASGDIPGAVAEISAMWGTPEASTEASGADDIIIDPAFHVDALQRLYGLLVTPIKSLLHEGAGLIVIPSSEMATVPFAMLVEPGDATDYASAPYLIRRYPVTNEVTAALLLEPPTEASGGDGLVFGRRTFEDRADLPFVGEEVGRVERTLPSPVVRLDASATETDFVARLPNADVIHLASHATADPEFPLYSQIVLADDPNTDDDGTLHLYELQSHPLTARLVVLSGCSTARGRTLEGEGMIGLQYAVRAAGAAASLATLWPVDDQATVDIMGRFYANMGEGMTKDRALQQAQLDYLDNHEGIAASPFYWAPAVLAGDTQPVPWRSGPSGWLWAVLGAAALVSAWVAWRLNHRRLRA